MPCLLVVGPRQAEATASLLLLILLKVALVVEALRWPVSAVPAAEAERICGGFCQGWRIGPDGKS